MTRQAAATTTTPATSMHASLRSFTDAAADAVARAIAGVQRDAIRERELRDAQFAPRMAELESRISAVSEIERKVADRLATLKDGSPGAAGRDGTNGTDGRDGTSVSVEDVQSMVRAECERILSTWERPQDGRSVTVDDVAPLIAETISAAIAALPPAKDGRDGLNGKDGQDGLDGQHGERGSDGAPGKLPIVTEWEDRVHYEGEVVTRDGSVFQALHDTGKAPGHDDWRCIVSAGANGREGQDGRSFNICGTWLEINEYRQLDVVALGGASFAAKRDNPGPCPGDGWQLIASQGKRGRAGEPGRQGLPGSRGEAAQTLIAASVDDEGLLTLISGDGSRVQCDLYPVLAKLKH